MLNLEKSLKSNHLTFELSVGSVMASIGAFQALDPGSNPGRRISYLSTHGAFFGMYTLSGVNSFIDLEPVDANSS